MYAHALLIKGKLKTISLHACYSPVYSYAPKNFYTYETKKIAEDDILENIECLKKMRTRALREITRVKKLTPNKISVSESEQRIKNEKYKIESYEGNMEFLPTIKVVRVKETQVPVTVMVTKYTIEE